VLSQLFRSIKLGKIMVLFKKADDLREYLARKKNESKTIGFVPTMGALHQGHPYRAQHLLFAAFL